MKYFYKFKFYINARHSVTFNDIKSHIHPHTWETVIHLEVKQSSFINFTQFENILEKYFDAYENRYLNDLDYFKDINPTMESLGQKIFSDITKLLRNYNLDICKIEISENPTRTYIIEK